MSSPLGIPPYENHLQFFSLAIALQSLRAALSFNNFTYFQTHNELLHVAKFSRPNNWDKKQKLCVGDSEVVKPNKYLQNTLVLRAQKDPIQPCGKDWVTELAN